MLDFTRQTTHQDCGELGRREFRSRGRWFAAIVIVLLTLTATHEMARADLGVIRFDRCYTAELESKRSCRLIAGARPHGPRTGLHAVSSVAVSPDGRFVYTVSPEDDALAVFRRSRRTGRLAYMGCITGNSNRPSCVPISSATVGGSRSGLDQATDVTVSPNSKSIYVASFRDAAVARFDQIATDSLPAYAGCITGWLANHACTPTASATTHGVSSGLDGPRDLAISADGASLYALSSLDDSVSWFGRTAGGDLSFKGCVSGATETGPSCSLLPHSRPGGFRSGYDSPTSLDLSSDGTSLYFASGADSAIVTLRRQASTGAISFGDCLTGDASLSHLCKTLPGADRGAVKAPLSFPSAVAVAGDGRSVFATSTGNPILLRLERSQAGRLSFGSCATGRIRAGSCRPIRTATFNGGSSGIDGAASLAVSLSGRNLYVAALGDSAISRFTVDSRGRLIFGGCISGSQIPKGCQQAPRATRDGDKTGFDGLQHLAMSANGRSIYGAGAGDSAVLELRRFNTPQTIIKRTPSRLTASRHARFGFTAKPPASRFECKLDRRAFSRCSSPMIYHQLDSGPHRFQVRAVSSQGRRDPTPASFRWFVSKRR